MNFDKIKTRTFLAWQSAKLNLHFRPVSWEVKSLPASWHNKTLTYVGIVISDAGKAELIKVSGYSFFGWKFAARNALSEYLEVTSCRRHKISSGTTRSGCAAGENYDDARERAWKELVERDAFLTHFLCSELMTYPLSNLSKNIESEIKFVQLQSPDPGVVVVLAVKFRQGWACLGLGTGNSVEAAALKAGMECEMLFSEWKVDESDVATASPKLKKYLPHWQSSKSIDTHARLQNIFAGGGRCSLEYNHKIDSSKVDFIETFPHAANINSAKMVVLRLTCDDLIPFTIGESWIEHQDQVLQVLRNRGLQGKWSIHPFL